MKADPALLVTRPPIQALAHSEGSGRPKRARVSAAETSAAAAPESVVLTKTRATRSGGTPLKRIAPAPFSPNHPIRASRQANSTSTALWPGMAAGMPSPE